MLLAENWEKASAQSPPVRMKASPEAACSKQNRGHVAAAVCRHAQPSVSADPERRSTPTRYEWVQVVGLHRIKGGHPWMSAACWQTWRLRGFPRSLPLAHPGQPKALIPSKRLSSKATREEHPPEQGAAAACGTLRRKPGGASGKSRSGPARGHPCWGTRAAAGPGSSSSSEESSC